MRDSVDMRFGYAALDVAELYLNLHILLLLFSLFYVLEMGVG